MTDFEDNKYNVDFRNIKSSFILKNIFSFLSEKEKLNIITYNKQLQKILSVAFEDYERISGKYRISQGNRIGKEYIKYTDRLLYEGEYLNGKRNGKGKEFYDDGKLLFEGEYLKGYRNGKGKEYNDDGNLKFEGEYLKGYKNGKGKEYNYYGELDFEGEYSNGVRWNGKGKEYYACGKLLFEGEFLNGKRWNGKYIEYYDDDKLGFEVIYLNGERIEKDNKNIK